MPARFADIKFNLMRAIELFEDMNHLDMDVTAPSSATNYYKEIEVAQRLNIYLGQLIDEGVFEDCDLRDDPLDDDEEEEGDEDDEDPDEPPRSGGFDYESGRAGPESQSLDADDRGSRESFTDRFKRYIRRIIPGGGRRRSEAQQDHAHEHDHHHHHGHHHHHHERSHSESGGIRPINATINAGSIDDDDYDQQGEGIYDPSSTSYAGSDSVHDGHPIHSHHRPASASTINSSEASGSARDSVIDDLDESESELDDAPLSPRSRSTSRSSTLSNRRSSSGGSRRSGSRRASRASSRTGRAKSRNSRASSRSGSRSRTGSRISRRQSTTSRGSGRSSRGRRSR